MYRKSLKAFADELAYRFNYHTWPLAWHAIDFVQQRVLGRARPNLHHGKVVPFVIAFTPRSGSNMLRRMLDSHPMIACHGEVTWINPNPAQISGKLRISERFLTSRLNYAYAAPARTLRQYLAHNAGCSVVGLKQTIMHGPGERGGNWHEVAFGNPGIRIILLKRKDKIRRALSVVRRRRSGVVEAVADEPVPLQDGSASVEEWARSEKAVKVRTLRQGKHVWEQPDQSYFKPIHVTFSQLYRIVDECERKEQQFDQFMQQRKRHCLRVYYEDVAAGSPEVFRDIIEYLDLPLDYAERLENVSLSLSGAKPLPELIANYEEIKMCSRNTKIEPLLAE